MLVKDGIIKTGMEDIFYYIDRFEIGNIILSFIKNIDNRLKR